jgi:hypothetical protein
VAEAPAVVAALGHLEQHPVAQREHGLVVLRERSNRSF